MPKSTNRRALLGTDDQRYHRTLDLWNRWLKQDEVCNVVHLPEKTVAKEVDALNEIEAALQGDMRSSVHALAAMLMIQMSHGGLEEIVADLHIASLAAIRPQLVGAIAEGADRVLAEEEEDA